jgi:hypothetical protein
MRPPGRLGGHGEATSNSSNAARYRLPHQSRQEQARLRRQRAVVVIHRLGARAVFELLDELARHHGIGADLDHRLERYADLDIDLLRTLGGDRFAPTPPWLIGRP